MISCKLKLNLATYLFPRLHIILKCQFKNLHCDWACTKLIRFLRITNFGFKNYEHNKNKTTTHSIIVTFYFITHVLLFYFFLFLHMHCRITTTTCITNHLFCHQIICFDSKKIEQNLHTYSQSLWKKNLQIIFISSSSTWTSLFETSRELVIAYVHVQHTFSHTHTHITTTTTKNLKKSYKNRNYSRSPVLQTKTASKFYRCPTCS